MVELLCKPKIMPLKSLALQRLEALDKQALENMKANAAASAGGNGVPRVGTSLGRPVSQVGSRVGGAPQSGRLA